MLRKRFGFFPNRPVGRRSNVLAALWGGLERIRLDETAEPMVLWELNASGYGGPQGFPAPEG